MNLVGKRVKIFFKNGTGLEGLVDNWNNNEAVLKTDQSNDLLIIYQPQENIMMLKVFMDVPNISEPEYQKQPSSEIDPQTSLEKLIEMRKEHIKNEKLIVKNKIHSPSFGASGVRYESPDFTKSSPFNSAPAQVTRSFRRNN